MDGSSPYSSDDEGGDHIPIPSILQMPLVTPVVDPPMHLPMMNLSSSHKVSKKDKKNRKVNCHFSHLFS